MDSLCPQSANTKKGGERGACHRATEPSSPTIHMFFSNKLVNVAFIALMDQNKVWYTKAGFSQGKTVGSLPGGVPKYTESMREGALRTLKEQRVYVEEKDLKPVAFFAESDEEATRLYTLYVCKKFTCNMKTFKKMNFLESTSLPDLSFPHPQQILLEKLFERSKMF